LHDSRIPAIGQAYLIQQYVIKLASDFGRCVSLDTLVAYIKVNKGNNKIACLDSLKPLLKHKQQHVEHELPQIVGVGGVNRDYMIVLFD
jgi:hypothetical protein